MAHSTICQIGWATPRRIDVLRQNRDIERSSGALAETHQKPVAQRFTATAPHATTTRPFLGGQKSNREAGNGRADIMLTPRPDCKGPGIIFEFKYCNKPEQLPGKAEEALRQIEEKRYIEEFKPEVKEVFGYGMSFCAKECNIKHKAWKL